MDAYIHRCTVRSMHRTHTFIKFISEKSRSISELSSMYRSMKTTIRKTTSNVPVNLHSIRGHRSLNFMSQRGLVDMILALRRCH